MDNPTTIEAAPVLLPLLAAYLVVVAVPAVRSRAGLTARRLALLTTLVGYAAAVVAVTLFPITLHQDDHWRGQPWHSVFRPVPFLVDAPSFILNVIMMVPLGVLLPLLNRSTNSLSRIVLYAGGTSVAIEATQFLLGVLLGSRRTVDINDLIANTGGAVLGLLLLRLAVPSVFGRGQVGTQRQRARTPPANAARARR